RRRLAVFLLGGLAVNAVLFGITFWLWRHSRVLDLSEDPLFGFWYAQLMLFVGTLIPLWTRISGTRIANDGMQLLLLSRVRHSIEVHRTYDELLAHYAPGRPPRMTEASDVLRELFTSGRARFDRRRTFDTIQPLLDGNTMSPEETILSLGLLIS